MFSKAINLFKKTSYILEDKKEKIPVLIIIFLASSLLDLIGIGLIAPYVGLIVNPEGFLEGDSIQFLISLGINGDINYLIIVLGLILSLTFLIKALASIYANKAILSFSHNIGLDIRCKLMSIYQNIPYIHYTQRNSSEYIYNIQQLSTQYSLLYLQSILRLISEGMVGIAILLLLAWTNIYALTILCLIVGGVMYIYDAIYSPMNRKYGELSNIHSTKMLQAINEGIGGVKEFRVLAKEDYFYQILNKEAKGFSDSNIKAGVISIMPRYFLEFILIVFVVFLVIFSIHLGKDLEALIPTLSVFGIASMRLIPSVSQIMNSMTKIRYSSHCVEILYKDLSIDKEIVDKSYNQRTTFQKLSLVNISFSYPESNKTVINNLTIDINSGESVGFIGASGSGKTTLIDIILGLLPPDTGKISFNNKSLSGNLSAWRSQVAYIPQDIFILDTSLEKNIAIDDASNVDKFKLRESIKQSQLEGLVKQLPLGVDTVLGERGVKLSGGQRQRIALARALYHDRNVIVMDEATSALDTNTEREIVKEIERLKGKKTLIVIAHRLSTLRHCDCIYRLEGGRIVEKSTYQKVMQNLK